MLSIPQDIPDFALSSQLDNFLISADRPVTLLLEQGDTVILQETYTPDAKNLIRILDLFSLMEPYLLAEPLLSFSYTLSASEEETLSKTFTVLLCRPYVPCTANEFVMNYFLSTLAGRNKVTALGRSEILYLTTGALNSGETSIGVTAECVFVDEQNQLLYFTYELDSVEDYGIRAIDASPSRFTQLGYQLLRYTITAGARQQTFLVNQDQPDFIGVKFRNSFGVAETISFAGGESVEPELTRNASYFSGQYKTYYVDEQRKHTLNTGYVPESMFALVDDVARATEVWLIDEYGDIPITVLESETKRDDALDGMFSFTITYVLASRCQQRLRLLPAIFDDTFDDTYN